MNWLAIALGAVLGAWGRYALMLWAQGVGVSWIGTLMANWLGCFAIGGVSAWLMQAPWPEPLRLAVMTGLLGALTTFSTWSLELWTLIQSQRFGLALSIFALHLLGGLLLTILGYWLGGGFSNLPTLDK